MFDFSRKSTTPPSKCYFTHSLLPPYIDPIHLPNKKQPFATISKQRFTHTLDLILPEELYTLINDELRSKCILHYSRVYLKLSEILSPDFLTKHIKLGNIAMISEGRPLIDNMFSLYDGVLRLELDRPTYERCGLQGVPIEDGGKKHQKARFLIEVNLKAPHMVHGKKGFGRVVRAAKEVLNRSLTWLVWEGEGDKKEEAEPLAMHHPFLYNVRPEVVLMSDVLVPRLGGEMLEGLQDMESSMDLLEWMHLAAMESPRVRKGDRIDDYLSRYQVPNFTRGAEEKDAPVSRNLVRVRWRGFMTPTFVKEIYLFLRRNGIGGGKDQPVDLGQKWFAMTANAFGGYGGCYTILQFAGRDILLWECN
jgi:ribonucleases P/MRP protein subunit RPP40